MKKLFFFSLSILCSVLVFAQQNEDWRVHPNDAKYYIKGVFDATTGSNGNSVYTLTNVETQGITIDDGKSVYYGDYIEAHDDVRFTFDHVDTNCPTKYDYISYWVFDDEISEWIPDVEIRSADRGMEHRKVMTVMLVLDCSSSLENEFVHDFRYVKEGALTFLRSMYNASKAGNIRIGIIGFNSLKRTQIRQIESLTEGSYLEMTRFINNLSVANGTALYYSLDKAIDMTNSYVSGFRNTSEYTSPIIVTFTDGIDQTSFDNKKKLKSADAYYNYVNNRIQENDIEHFVIPFKGSDISTDAQKDKFERVLRSLTKPDDNAHYLPVTTMSELGSIFGSIANSLIDRWQILRCYVAPARQGKVCWTFGKKEKEAPKKVLPPPPAPKKGRNVFIGLGGNIGAPMTVYSEKGYSSLDFGSTLNFAFDWAYPITDHFGMGTYVSLGGGLMFGSFEGAFNFKTGLLMMFGDVNDRPFLLGIAPFTGFTFAGESGSIPFELKFGRAVNEHLYITGNVNMYIPDFGIEPSITIGYHFGDKLQTNR